MFVLAVICFVMAHVSWVQSSLILTGLEIGSSVTCGLAWLLSRALFRQTPQRDYWPEGLVALLFLSTLVLRFTSIGTAHPVMAYLDNVHSLIASAMLVLIAVEAVSARPKRAEDQKFRRVFIAGYLLILGVALSARIPDLAEVRGTIQVSLSILAALGATLAVYYRTVKASLQSAKTSNPDLARRLTRLMTDGSLYRQPALKVSDLAIALNEPEYRISQSIVADLGQSNFNQWVNSYRIAEAKARLAAQDAGRVSIINLSLDCGFNSLGPFNRAFKAETGFTPTQFRKHALDQAIV